MKKRKLKMKIIVTGLFLFLLIQNCKLFAQNNLTEGWEMRYLDRQPPAKVMDLLGIKPGMIIGEIGAGRGRMTVYFAREVGPAGKVYANDIDELSLSYLKGRCRRLGFSNVELITGKEDDPLLPEKKLDMAVMVLVYHMIEKPDKLLENIKKSLRPGAMLVIIDPVDEEIDREFGIDRSKPGTKPPTIRERIAASARVAGYEIVTIDSSLSRDIIFFLKPGSRNTRMQTGELLVSTILASGTDAARREFERMKKDTLKYDMNEMEFRKAGNDFIGSRSYTEAVAVIQMGIELYPESSLLYADLGEAYMMAGHKEKSREAFKKGLSLDPGNPNGKYLIENFDSIYESVHPGKSK